MDNNVCNLICSFSITWNLYYRYQVRGQGHKASWSLDMKCATHWLTYFITFYYFWLSSHKLFFWRLLPLTYGHNMTLCDVNDVAQVYFNKQTRHESASYYLWCSSHFHLSTRSSWWHCWCHSGIWQSFRSHYCSLLFKISTDSCLLWWLVFYFVPKIPPFLQFYENNWLNNLIIDTLCVLLFVENEDLQIMKIWMLVPSYSWLTLWPL